MKKHIITILLVILLIPFMVKAETCDQGKITISSIKIEEKSDNVEEIEGAIATGKNLNLNLSMSEVGDNIRYKVIMKNDSDEDYELDKNSLNINSNYVDYTIETNDDSNILKANSSKIVYLKVEYKSKVPEDQFESGIYNDNKAMTFSLATGDTVNITNTLKNPKTGAQLFLLILLIILLVSFTIYVMIRKKQYAKFMILIAFISIIIPISVYAICKCEINIKSNIKIKSQTNTTFSGIKYGVYPNTDTLVINDIIPSNAKLHLNPNDALNDWIERLTIKSQ